MKNIMIKFLKKKKKIWSKKHSLRGRHTVLRSTRPSGASWASAFPAAFFP